MLASGFGNIFLESFYTTIKQELRFKYNKIIIAKYPPNPVIQKETYWLPAGKFPSE